MKELVHYKTYGSPSNPSLLIIHGLFGSLDNWQSLAKKWSDIFYVITIDVRNHGKSFHSNDMSFEAMSMDIIHLLAVENISQAHIIGHSMGGKIAMDFASIYPQMVNHLIVADVAPYQYSPHHRDVFEMLDAIDLTLYSSRQEIDIAIRQFIDKDSIVQFMNKNIRRDEDTLEFKWKFNLPVLKRNYAYLIERIPPKMYAGKTLFIAGQSSDYITKETSIHIPDLFPNYELEIVSNAGHWLHADNPIDFYEKINRFLIPE